MKLGNSPNDAPYVIRHVTSKHAYIKRASMPPRTCDWTDNVAEAEVFEHINEAKYCAEFITKFAFNVEVVDKDEL